MTQSIDADIQPATINKISGGMWHGFALLAGAQLDLFTTLSEQRMTVDETAAATGSVAAKLGPLMYALAEYGLLEESGGQFGNSDEAQAFLVRGEPGYMGILSGFTPTIWRAALGMADTVREGKPVVKLDFAGGPPEQIEGFIRNLLPGALQTGKNLAERFDLSGRRALVDVGGGSGGVAIALTEAVPGMRGTVVDLPTIIPVTEAVIREQGAADRVAVVSGDAANGSIDGEYDLAVMKAIIQVLGPEEARRAVRNVAEALTPGGELHVIGSILDDSRRAPAQAVSFNLALINLYDEGQAYTEAEHRAWLEEAGFVDVTRIDEPGFTGIRAVKAG